MSALSSTERRGFIEMFSYLSDSDLRALCDTVTHRMIAVESAAERLEAILTYTRSAEELLRRKKVHRDAIFKYLSDQKVVISPTAEKGELVRRALELWRGVSQVSVLVGDPTEGISSDCEQGDAWDQPALAKQFCQWFFQVLNSQNPALGQEPLAWGPQHFWENVTLKLQSWTEEEQMDEFYGARLVSLRLLALVREERLLFSPNLEPHGLKYTSSPHGLVVVAVAGTIHRNQVCLGIFEQVFGLIRSPLDSYSWKIKFVHLKIRGQNALAGGEAAKSPALTYDSNELQLLCD
ncbi:uncharacterized protein C3orf38 homolog [Scleropages formosus]|uniref:Chromosome 3 open reading frame 38 n=1 Tax=Scleropages formosus TaxID=113540 RepID=A0A8C9RAJ7_SCLFO|nr:uncharacterized protein C3orf38 homolog [Scleropages formosus]